MSVTQKDANTLVVQATNSSESTLQFSARIEYSYKSYTGERHHDSRLVHGSLASQQHDDFLATISDSLVTAERVKIIFAN